MHELNPEFSIGALHVLLTPESIPAKSKGGRTKVLWLRTELDVYPIPI